MEFHYFDTYEAMSQEAQRIFDAGIKDIPHPKVILATGNSPLKLYRNLATSGKSYSHLSVIKLDEWLGLPMNHPSTCEYYLQQEFLLPNQIPSNQYLAFESQPDNPEEECRRIHEHFDSLERVDLCILGIGKNGHLGLNEPAESLQPYCHVSVLEDETKNHTMLSASHSIVNAGLTLGIADILRSRQILLLVSGQSKREVLNELKTKKISTYLPASFLWLHPNVQVLIDSLDDSSSA